MSFFLSLADTVKHDEIVKGHEWCKGNLSPPVEGHEPISRIFTKPKNIFDGVGGQRRSFPLRTLGENQIVINACH